MLVAAVVGLETRATLDIDTTVKSLPLTMETARWVVEDVIRTDVPDGVSFRITKVSDIMEGHDYPGIRFILEAFLDKMKQAIKVDISTGDIITPGAVEYSYKLMFEDRSISIWTYNLETLLGEKLETIMARETANTRMRDFYDIHIFDACEPAVVPIRSIEEIDSRKIIVATIRPGMAKPYYLRKYGMMDGTWIRIAGVTRKAEPYMIKELQLEGTGASFDTLQVMGEVTPAEIDVLCNRMYQHALARCLSEEQRTE